MHLSAINYRNYCFICRMKKEQLPFLPKYFDRYIHRVTENDLMLAFADSEQVFVNLPVDQISQIADLAYAPGKWTIKELFQHLIDCERIFAYRSLCISRGEKQSLLSFEEDDYAKNSDCSRREFADILTEFASVRESTFLLYNSFTEKMLLSEGLSGGNPITVAAIGFSIIGHRTHHLEILKERYLPMIK